MNTIHLSMIQCRLIYVPCFRDFRYRSVFHKMLSIKHEFCELLCSERHINTIVHVFSTFFFNMDNTRGADKSLARTGRKEATVTKLGIYSTYSPRSSIHCLARCCNFCKPLKKIQKVVRPTRSPRQR